MIRIDASSKLDAHGIRVTNQRIIVLQEAYSGEKHFTADDLLTRINAERNRVCKASIYNTLKLFARKGLIKTLGVKQSSTIYDSCVEPHHHFYNVDTEEITDITEGLIVLNPWPEPPPGKEITAFEVVMWVQNLKENKS